MDGTRPLVPAGRPRSRGKRWAIIAAGWFFIFLGFVGAVLPVLQGWLFFAIGLILLSREVAWAHRLRRNLFRRFPKLGACSEEAEAWVGRQGARIAGWFRR
jgi:uncharacterized membrane protein YbaN (DUF454 family)